MNPDSDFATRCVHAADSEDAYGAPHTPIYNTTTFTFPSTTALNAAVEDPQQYPLYTRYGSNPSLYAVERQLAALETAEGARVFASGMAAISATALALGAKGVVCLGNVYGGTLELVDDQLPGLGIPTHILYGDAVSELEAILAGGCGLVIVETPTNPTLEVHDILRIAALVHRHGGLLAVDNTFATPVNQQPLALGADLVLHSATKYLGGHSDLTAGAAMGNEALLRRVAAWRRSLGQTPAPETAALLSRSMRTLAVRVERQNANAQRIAEAMASHPRVQRVCYPGLAEAPQQSLAHRQMSGFGGMLSIELTGDITAATEVVDRLRLFRNAPSLGGVESLATQPAVTSHAGLPPEERRCRGIGDTMIRLSVGLESAGDLIADLSQALAGVTQA